MSFTIAALLIVGGLVLLGAFAFGLLGVIGLTVWDIASSRKNKTAQVATASAVAAKEATELSHDEVRGRIRMERGFARGFVIAGGIFWGIAVFAGMYSFRQESVAWSMLGAFVPLVATLATLAVGWFYERAAAIMLVLASAGVVYWGVVHQFEAGVWILMTLALIGPMMTAAVLFWMARSEQVALELSMASQPELAPVEARI